MHHFSYVNGSTNGDITNSTYYTVSYNQFITSCLVALEILATELGLIIINEAIEYTR